jgi:predicted dehydrogenase
MLSRRTFLGSSAVLLASQAHARDSSDILNIGCIGTGGRCRHLMRSLAKISKVRIAGVCDIYDKNLAEAKSLADPKAFVTRNYPDLLARKDIDAVLIGSPDHWHVPMTIDSVAAGKDVYVEKPLTHDLSEGEKVIAAVKKSKQMVQIGTQQRSMPHIIAAKKLVSEGKLGTIIKVRMSWNRNTDRVRKGKPTLDAREVNWKAFLGNAPKQDFDEYRFRNWRWFWDFGGGLFTDLMVHWVDVAHWFLDVDHPLKAVSLGEFHAAKDVWQTPDTVQTLMSYKNGIQMHYEGTFSNARAGAMIEFLGTDGTLYIDRGRYEFTTERGKGMASEMILGKGRKGADFYETPDGELLHLEDWITAIRKRKQPSAPVEAGVSAASAAHLANLALRGDGVAKWGEK